MNILSRNIQREKTILDPIIVGDIVYNKFTNTLFKVLEVFPDNFEAYDILILYRSNTTTIRSTTRNCKHATKAEIEQYYKTVYEKNRT